jgi:hypothetical protein
MTTPVLLNSNAEKQHIQLNQLIFLFSKKLETRYAKAAAYRCSAAAFDNNNKNYLLLLLM